MKKLNKFFLPLAVIALLFNNCESDDKIVDQVTAETERGAILRTVELVSGVFDAFVPSSQFMVTLEVEDHENGDLLESVDVFATYVDNNPDNGDNSTSEIMIDNISASAFSPGRFGLPVTTYAISLSEVANALGLSEDDYEGGDTVAFRFELNLTDGRSYSAADANGGIRFGSFFSSPYTYNVNLICGIPEDAFVGSYTLSSVTNGQYGPTFSSSDQEVTVTIGDTPTKRQFQAVYLGDFGIGNGPTTFTFDLVCGDILIPGGQTSGLACVSAITFGPPAGDNGTFDVADDSVITINFTEDETSDCNPPQDVTIQLVKN